VPENVANVCLALGLFKKFPGFIGQENELKYCFSSEKACALAVRTYFRLAAFVILYLAWTVKLFYLVGGNIKFSQQFFVGFIRFLAYIAQFSCEPLQAVV